MYDGGKIIAGLIIGLGLLAFPFYNNTLFGKAAPAPKPELTAKAKEAKACVAPTGYMRSWHMQMLDDWRHSVVRDGERYYNTDAKPWEMRLDRRILEGWRHFVVPAGKGDQPATAGKVYYKSLQVTCMDCHSNKSKFCDQCHNYMGVSPYCWDCHIEPKENK
ncbi:MAG: cytochrome C [Deltaproteobacteria bacterium]|nr:cytochrome C [Deltaproteobacteria bacterium]